MKIKYFFPFLLGGAVMATTNACSEAKSRTLENSQKTETTSAEKEAMLQQYSETPREELLQDAALWEELKGRYQQNLSTLNDKIKATGAKLVVMYTTPEFGESMTPAQREGKPFIEKTCGTLGIQYVDLTTHLKDKKPEEITNMPIDGHWSKLGAQLIAADLEGVITGNAAHKATATYTERPTLFGDQKPNQDEVLDGGKNLPYRLQTNSQGLRMDYNLAFPKAKQRILFMGDSGFFFPFMDNKFIVSNLLQAKFADKEFANACNWGYAIDDYISLFDERAKFIEPDVVMLQTSATDILDMYFSHRNRFSRSKNAAMPTATEKAFYEKTFKK